MNLILVFVLAILTLTPLYIFRGRITAAGRAIGGVAGGNFFQNYGWLIVAIIVVPICYLMLTGGMAQTLAAVVAIVVAIFALNLLMSSPPNSWVFAAVVALTLLFISWDPTWRYVEDAKNWWIGEAPAQTAAELEASIPVLHGNVLRVPAGSSVTYRLDHVVQLPDHGCHDLLIMPRGVFGLTRGNGSYTVVTPPVIGEYTTITVQSVAPLGNPQGC